MSLQIFKQNMLSYMRNQNFIDSKESFAKKLVTEYDLAVKRGFDTINGISVISGNTELMERVLISVLNEAQQQSSGEYAIITNIGRAFKAYWAGASMNLLPPPLPSITPLGVMTHITQVSNFITTTGNWNPSDITFDATSDLKLPEKKSIYDELDWSSIGLDKNSPDVQMIINPNLADITNAINSDLDVVNDRQLGSTRVTQLDNNIASIIDNALYEQGILDIPDDNIKTTFKNLDELLYIASKKARILRKNPRIVYQTLRSSYIRGVHGLCPQGTQAVVAALTGINELGKIPGNANDFTIKRNRSNFDIQINGKRYYNSKVRVGLEYISSRSSWQIGDIIAVDYISNPYGHIQVWTGWKWVSDFTQNKIQTNKIDYNTLTLWRLNKNGIESVNNNRR